MYAGLKHSHLLFIAISIILFEWRFFMKVLKKPSGRIMKIVPHINDTLLLITGISLAIMAGFNPFQQVWLGSKIIALFFYIGFGIMALKANGTKSTIAYVLVTATFVFMAFTAINKTPLFFG